MTEHRSPMRDWVLSHYGERIRAVWSAQNPNIADIDLGVRPRRPEASLKLPSTPERLDADALDTGGNDPVVSAPEAAIGGGDMGSPLDPRFRFDSFVVGKSNELAYAAAHRVAASPTVTFNPLFLYGGVGLGKTHLMHAIAWHIQELDPERKVIYLSAEKFMPSGKSYRRVSQAATACRNSGVPATGGYLP